jgi:hypothetical protein
MQLGYLIAELAFMPTIRVPAATAGHIGFRYSYRNCAAIKIAKEGLGK